MCLFLISCHRKFNGCGYFPPVHIFHIPIALLNVEEPLSYFAVFQVLRVVLRHVPDLHCAAAKVLRDFFPTKRWVLLLPPPPFPPPVAASCAACFSLRSRPLYPLTR